MVGLILYAWNGKKSRAEQNIPQDFVFTHKPSKVVAVPGVYLIGTTCFN